MTRIESLRRDLILQARFLVEDFKSSPDQINSDAGIIPSLKTAEGRLTNIGAMLHTLIELSSTQAAVTKKGKRS